MTITKITDGVRDPMSVAKLSDFVATDLSPLQADIVSSRADILKVRSDILKLALHQAIDGNRVAYNLEDSFVDGFEDSSGLTTLTDTERNAAGEYVNSIGGIAVDSNTLLLVQSNTTDGSTTVTDDSVSNRTVTLVGQTSHSTTQAKVGTSSLYFDGTGDSLNVPYESTWAFANTDFTMEYWAYFPSSVSGECFAHSTTGSWAGIAYAFGVNTSGALSYQGLVNGGQVTVQGTGGAITTGSWHHIAITRTGSYFKGYVNGVENLSFASGDFRVYTAPFKFANGQQWGVPQAYVDFIRVSNIARYTSNFTPTTPDILGQTINATGTLISDPQTASTSRTSASGVIIYEDAEGTSTLGTDLKIYFSCDNSTWTEASSYGTPQIYSGTKKLVKLGATTCTAGTSIAMKAEWANQEESILAKTVSSVATTNHSTTQAKFGSSSIYQDASGRLTIADHADFNAISGTGDFTIDFWMHTGGAYRIAGKGDSVAYPTFNMWLGGSGAKFSTLFYHSGGSSSISVGGGGANLNDNAWHHIAIVRDGTTFTSYVDGTSNGTATSSASINSNSENIVFGDAYTNGSGDFVGYMDSIRISNNARWTSNFSVPTSAHTSDANTMLLVNSNNATNGSTVFNDATGVTGKQARLHGWAVNY